MKKDLLLNATLENTLDPIFQSTIGLRNGCGNPNIQGTPTGSTAVSSLLASKNIPCKVIILVVINAPEQSSSDDFNLNKKAYEETRKIKVPIKSIFKFKIFYYLEKKQV